MKFSQIIYAVLIVLFFYFAGNYFEWFINYEWFDMPMHFAGGFAMGMLAVYLLARGQIAGSPKWIQFLFVLMFAVFAGVLWEYYEFAIDGFVTRKFGWQPMTLSDSLSDLFFDGIGGALAWQIYKAK